MEREVAAEQLGRPLDEPQPKAGAVAGRRDLGLSGDDHALVLWDRRGIVGDIDCRPPRRVGTDDAHADGRLGSRVVADRVVDEAVDGIPKLRVGLYRHFLGEVYLDVGVGVLLAVFVNDLADDRDAVDLDGVDAVGFDDLVDGDTIGAQLTVAEIVAINPIPRRRCQGTSRNLPLIYRVEVGHLLIHSPIALFYGYKQRTPH